MSQPKEFGMIEDAFCQLSIAMTEMNAARVVTKGIVGCGITEGNTMWALIEMIDHTIQKDVDRISRALNEIAKTFEVEDYASDLLKIPTIEF